MVLVVLRPTELASASQIEEARKTWVTMAGFLKEEGVNAVCAIVPPTFDFEVIEVKDGE